MVFTIPVCRCEDMNTSLVNVLYSDHDEEAKLRKQDFYLNPISIASFQS